MRVTQGYDGLIIYTYTNRYQISKTKRDTTRALTYIYIYRGRKKVNDGG